MLVWWRLYLQPRGGLGVEVLGWALEPGAAAAPCGALEGSAALSGAAGSGSAGDGPWAMPCKVPGRKHGSSLPRVVPAFLGATLSTFSCSGTCPV